MSEYTFTIPLGATARICIGGREFVLSDTTQNVHDDLLAALKKAGALIGGEFPRRWPIHAEIDAAIAKAEAPPRGKDCDPMMPLRLCEWAGVIWGDVAVCPVCGAVRDGLLANLPTQPPNTHKPGCALKTALDNGDK